MSKTTFPARVRFNWGFHDGASEQASFILANWARNRFDRDSRAAMKAHDSAWAEGFDAGLSARKGGQDTSDSTAAWRAR